MNKRLCENIYSWNCTDWIANLRSKRWHDLSFRSFSLAHLLKEGRVRMENKIQSVNIFCATRSILEVKTNTKINISSSIFIIIFNRWNKFFVSISLSMLISIYIFAIYIFVSNAKCLLLASIILTLYINKLIKTSCAWNSQPRFQINK